MQEKKNFQLKTEFEVKLFFWSKTVRKKEPSQIPELRFQKNLNG